MDKMGSILMKQAVLKTGPILITGLIAIPGGLLFDLLRIPLPWMLGPLTATLFYNALVGGRARWSMLLRNAGLIVIGYSMGRTVTPEIIGQIMANLPGMAVATLSTILFALGTGYITHRRTGISLESGLLGSMPGGLAQMILLGEEVKGADLTVVTVMQMTRVMAVVFIVPFIATYGMAHPHGGLLPFAQPSLPWSPSALPALLAALLGAGLAWLLRLPIPFLLGPIFATIAAVLAGFPAPHIPVPVTCAAQLCFGIYMGLVITLERLRRSSRVLPYAAGGAILLVAFTYTVSLGLRVVAHANLLSAFLGTAAGGVAEMGIAALTLGADVAFVLTYQLFRMLTILLVMPPILRWRFRQ
jgi:uncharacterized protein